MATSSAPSHPATPTPSPTTLAYIKEKTRGLHRIKRDILPPVPTPSLPPPPAPPSSNPNSTTAFPSPPPSPSPANAAIARLRAYTHEQHLLRTADEWRSHTLRRRALHRWQLHLDGQRELHVTGLRLRQRLRLRRLQAAVEGWRAWAQRRLQSVVPPPHLTSFYARHLQRLCLTAWVGHTLTRQHKRANVTLACYMARSALLQLSFRLWQRCTDASQQQGALHRRAEAFNHSRVQRETLAVWRHQRLVSAKEREKERRAAAVGDGVRRRYYLRRWRLLSKRVQADEEAALKVEVNDAAHLLRHAWATWKEELQWRHHAAAVVKRLERSRREWAMKAALEDWQRGAEMQREEAARMDRAAEWDAARRRGRGLRAWRDAVRLQRAERMREDRRLHQLSDALHRWQRWGQSQQRLASAQRMHRQSLLSHSWQCWAQAHVDCRAEREQVERAELHWRRGGVAGALHRWLQTARQRRQRSTDLRLADVHHQRRQLLTALSTLLQYSRAAHRLRLLDAVVRSCHQRRAVTALHQHALVQRRAWQQHLAAKRCRYLHLLSSALSRWQKAADTERAKEDALMQERCGDLLHALMRQLFHAWRAQLRQRLIDREREGTALQTWRHRLLQSAFGDWHLALHSQRVDAQRAAVADSWWTLHQRWAAVHSWVAFTRAQSGLRAAEDAATLQAQVHLRALATRRAWQQLLQRFHDSRAARVTLQLAALHNEQQLKVTTAGLWMRYAKERKRRRAMRQQADRAYGAQVSRAAWDRWKGRFAERRRLLALHLKAIDWRRVHEERRAWAGWMQWLHSRRHLKRREEDMRRMRLERLRVEGCRQWIAVGLDWIQRDEEAQRATQAARRRERDEARRRLHAKAAMWVQRIARHWRRLSGRRREGDKAEQLQPLLSAETLRRWRAAAVRAEASGPLPLAQSRAEEAPPHWRRWPAREDWGWRTGPGPLPEYRSALTLAALSSSSSSADSSYRLSAVPVASASAVAAAVASGAALRPRGRRVRTEPRRPAELLLHQGGIAPAPPSWEGVNHWPPPPVISVPPPAVATALSRSQAAAALRPFPLPTAATTAPSAASLPLEDVEAVESRLRFLAALRAEYRTNAAELLRLQRRLEEEGAAMADAALSDLRERCRALQAACADFEQQRAAWKAEVAAWSAHIAAAQQRSEETSIAHSTTMQPRSPPLVRSTVDAAPASRTIAAM